MALTAKQPGITPARTRTHRSTGALAFAASFVLLAGFTAAACGGNSNADKTPGGGHAASANGGEGGEFASGGSSANTSTGGSSGSSHATGGTSSATGGSDAAGGDATG